MTINNFKSPLHDATATWNGFSYQGKIGLYVCLKLIHDALFRGDDIEEFCSKHEIEFEWLEDFSILKNNEYISHHQVKHYHDTDFSKYIDAFVTILSRQQGRLSENDLLKYLEYYAKVSKNKTFVKEDYLKGIIDSLKSNNIINASKFVEKSSEVNLLAYLPEEMKGINQYLIDFDNVNKQFESCKIYLHTSQSISHPNMDISKYTDIKNSHVLVDDNIRSLKGHDIYCSFDDPSEFELALTDEFLTQKLNDLSISILGYINSKFRVTDDSLKLYVAAMKARVEQYVVDRHQQIHTEENNLFGHISKIKLSFTDIFNCLKMEIIDETKDEYWELICRENFENAYGQILHLFEPATDLQSITNLKRFYSVISDKYIRTKELLKLLKALKPHVTLDKCSSKSDYYHQKIASNKDIESAFFNFLEGLNIEHDDCLSFFKEGQCYQTSSISLNESNKNTREKK